MKLSLTFVLLLLFSGLVVFGDSGVGAARHAPETAPTDRCATVRCFQGGHITCDNYGGRSLDGCACVCTPPDGSTNSCTEASGK